MTDEIVDALYAAPLEEFIGRRDAAAKELAAAGDRDGAKAVKALKKPTQVGWALNALARAAPNEVQGLVDVGAALRSAQEQLSGPQLRVLAQQRQAVVLALTRRTREVAQESGSPLTDAVAEQVRRSLDAALTDAGLGSQLLHGRNVGGLEYTGLGFGQSLAVVPRPTSDARPGTAEAAAEAKAARQAQAAELKRARAALTKAQRAHEAAVAKREKLEAVLNAAHLAAASAQESLDRALADEVAAETAFDAARTAENEAAQTLEDAEADLPE